MTNGYYYIARRYFSYCGVQKPYLTQSIIEAFDFGCRLDCMERKYLNDDIRFLLETYNIDFIKNNFKYERIYEKEYNNLCIEEENYIKKNKLHKFYPYYINNDGTYKDLNKSKELILHATNILEGQGFRISHGHKTIKITKDSSKNINMYAFNYLIRYCGYFKI